MKTVFKLDFYSKFILTLIAITLFALLFQSFETKKAIVRSRQSEYIYIANPEDIADAISIAVSTHPFDVFDVNVINHDDFTDVNVINYDDIGMSVGLWAD